MPINENLRLTVTAQDQASRALGNIQNKILAVGSAYLGWRAISGIVTDLTKAFADQQRTWGDLEASVRRHGLALSETMPLLRRFADEMQTMTGISDEVIAQAAQRFIDFGLDAKRALDTVRVALDLSAGSGQDFMASVDLLSKAAVGYTATLSRYGIIIDENIPKSERFAAAIDQINQRFGGAALARADQLATRIDVLGQKWGDFQERMGAVISPAVLIGVESAIEMLRVFGGNVGETTDDLIQLRKEAQLWGASFATAAKIIYESGRAIKNVIDLSIIDPLMAVYNTGNAVFTALLDPFNIEAWKKAGKFLSQIKTGVVTDFNEIVDSINNIQTAAAEFGLRVIEIEFDAIKRQAEQTAPAINSVAAEIQPIVAMYDQLDDAVKRFMFAQHDVIISTTEAIAGTGDVQKRALASLLADIENSQMFASRIVDGIVASVSSAAHSIVDIFWGSRESLAKIFSQMAQDFSHYFVEAILETLAKSFAPKFIGFLVSIFDQPANDASAYREGSRFASFFAQGALDRLGGLNLGGRMVSAITVGQQSRVVLDQLIPQIEKAASLNQSRIALRPSIATGVPSAVIT